MTKTEKRTRQGVRDLNAIGNATPKKHVHKYVPEAYTNRQGYQTPRMRCYCGAVSMESEPRSLRGEVPVQTLMQYYDWSDEP